MYLVYSSIDGNIFPACICATVSDAEEMCLSYAWEEYYRRWFIDQQFAVPKGFETIYIEKPTLINSGCYNYKEVPFVG